MKKVLASFCLVSLLSVYSPALAIEEDSNIPQEPEIQAQNVEDIIPPNAKVQYIYLKRPKWAYPVAWLGYVGTCLLVPFPILMKNKDKSVAENNEEYYRLEGIKQQYYSEIETCQTVYKRKEDLLPCYQFAKNNVMMSLNNNLANKQYQTQLKTNKLIKYSIIQDQFNANRPRYSQSTVTPVGNTYHVNTVSY